jgi:hypothetical protein
MRKGRFAIESQEPLLSYDSEDVTVDTSVFVSKEIVKRSHELLVKE